MSEVTVAYVRDGNDVAVIKKHVAPAELVLPESLAAAAASVSELTAQRFIIELELVLAHTSQFLKLLKRLRPDVAVLLRYSPTRLAARALLAACDLPIELRDSHREHDDLAVRLSDPALGHASALWPLLRIINASAPLKLKEFFAHAACCCSRTTRESEVLNTYGTSPPAVRRMLRFARAEGYRIPKWCNLNANTVALYVAHSRECNGLSALAAAKAAGRTSTRQLNRYLKNNLGVSPRTMLARGGYEAILTSMEAWFKLPEPK